MRGDVLGAKLCFEFGGVAPCGVAFGLWADEGHGVSADDDVVLESVDDDSLVFWRVDEASLGVFEVGVVVDYGVGLWVFWALLVDGVPGPDVAPGCLG